MDTRPTNVIIAGAILLIVGLAILIMPELLPVLMALTLIVLGLIGLYIGFTRRRVF